MNDTTDPLSLLKSKRDNAKASVPQLPNSSKPHQRKNTARATQKPSQTRRIGTIIENRLMMTLEQVCQHTRHTQRVHVERALEQYFETHFKDILEASNE